MPEQIMTIFHLSDIHIGEPGVQLEDLRHVISKIEQASKESVSPFLLITGDLTTEGLYEEYEAVNDALDGISIPHLILPGNHDERNYGAAHFERLFGSRFKTFTNDNVAIFGADSAEPDNDAGHVGREHYSQIREFFEYAEDKIKIFALHHHLVPVPHTGREYNVVEDSGDVLGELEAVRCSLVLNGHRHVPWMWLLNDMILYNTGTLLSRRIRGATTQAYTRISLTQQDATFILYHKDGTHQVFRRAPLRR